MLVSKCQNKFKISNFKPKFWNTEVQVFQRIQNQSTWKFNTLLGTLIKRNSVCSMTTPKQIHYDRWIQHWKNNVYGYISASYCPMYAKVGRMKLNHTQTLVTWPKQEILKLTADILKMLQDAWQSSAVDDVWDGRGWSPSRMWMDDILKYGSSLWQRSERSGTGDKQPNWMTKVSD